VGIICYDGTLNPGDEVIIPAPYLGKLSRYSFIS
jgi:hypothetical protein